MILLIFPSFPSLPYWVKRFAKGVMEHCQPKADLSKFLNCHEIQTLRNSFTSKTDRYSGGGGSVDLSDLKTPFSKMTSVRIMKVSLNSCLWFPETHERLQEIFQHYKDSYDLTSRSLEC